MLLPEYATFIIRCLIFATMHSLFATDRIKHILGQITKGTAQRFYRLIYNLLSLAAFVWVMGAYRGSPVLYTASGMWKWFMITAQLVTAALICLCVHQTGAGDFLGIKQVGSLETLPRSLVTRGWYARVRHPLYFFSTLFLLLNPVMTAQWALLSLFSLTYFIVGGIIEERRMLKEYGEEYEQYRRQVPFLIPRIGTPAKCRSKG